MSIKSEFFYIEEAKEQLASALISKFGVQEQDALNEDGTVKTKGLYTVNSDGTKNYLKRLHDWTALVTATSTGITSLAGLKFTDDYDSASGPGITYYGTDTYTVSYKTVGAAAASHSHSKITNTVGTASLTMSLAPISMYGGDSQYYINFEATGAFTAGEVAGTSVKTFPSLILGQDILGSYIPETIYFGTKQAQTTLVASGYKVPGGSSTKLLASDGSTVDANSLVDQVSNAVTLTGNQNVTGVKSFSDVVISSTSKSYILYNYVSPDGLTSANLGAIGFIPDVTKDPVTATNGGQAVRWDSDRNTYVILDTSSTYIKDGTITINGVPITPLVASDITNKIDYSNAVTEIGTKDKQLTWKKGDAAQTALTIPYATIADHLEVNKIAEADFDKFYHDFKVSYRGGSNGFTSNPEKDNGFGVMQLRVADGYSGQIALSHTGALYTRTAADSSFSSSTTWRTIGDSSNITIAKDTSISVFGTKLEALPNPNSITVFGIKYTGKDEATVNEKTLIGLLKSGDVTDNTEIITSGKTAFKDTLYKNKASDLLKYVRNNAGTLTLQINGNTQVTYNTTDSSTFNVSLDNLGAVNKAGDKMEGPLTAPELITPKITSKDLALSIYTTNDEKSIESLKISDGGISTGKITISDTKTGFLKTNGDVDYTVYAKNDHKHDYSDLTGSTTEKNQVIISTGATDNWTLKTLNISNWDDAYAFYQEITNKDDEPDKTINKWSEIVDFLDGIDSTAEGSQTLKQLLEAATNAAVTALSWDDVNNQLQWTKAGKDNPLEIKYATTAGNLTAWTNNNPGEGLYLTHESNATDSQGNTYSANVINIKTSNSTSQLRLDYGSTNGQAANVYYQSDTSNTWDRLLFARELTDFKDNLKSLKYRTILGGEKSYNPTDTEDSEDLISGIYYAALPIGFDSQDIVFNDGPTGTPLTSWHKKDGGSIAFYNNSNKLDLAVDGHLYIQKNIPVLGSITDGTYWGICTSAGNDVAAIRTTSTGILPYESSSTGASSIGSSDWYFKESYIKTMHGTAENANAVILQGLATNPPVEFENSYFLQNDIEASNFVGMWGLEYVNGTWTSKILTMNTLASNYYWADIQVSTSAQNDPQPLLPTIYFHGKTDTWTDPMYSYSHPWYGYSQHNNKGVYSLTLSDYFGMTLRTDKGNISITRNGSIGINTYEPSSAYALDINGSAKMSKLYIDRPNTTSVECLSYSNSFNANEISLYGPNLTLSAGNKLYLYSTNIQAQSKIYAPGFVYATVTDSNCTTLTDAASRVLIADGTTKLISELTTSPGLAELKWTLADTAKASYDGTSQTTITSILLAGSLFVDANNAAYIEGTHIGDTTYSLWNKKAPVIPLVRTDGVMEIGKYLDFHENADVTDYSTRIQAINTYGVSSDTEKCANILYLPTSTGHLALTSEVITKPSNYPYGSEKHQLLVTNDGSSSEYLTENYSLSGALTLLGGAPIQSKGHLSYHAVYRVTNPSSTTPTMTAYVDNIAEFFDGAATFSSITRTGTGDYVLYTKSNWGSLSIGLSLTEGILQNSTSWYAVVFVTGVRASEAIKADSYRGMAMYEQNYVYVNTYNGTTKADAEFNVVVLMLPTR